VVTIGFAATGIGSLPGVDADEATRIVAGELPDLPHVVELPARGPGSDMIGRTMAMLAGLAPDLAVETTPDGWRFADAPGRVMRRASSWLAEDLDAAAQHFAGAALVKTQVCGPWTLAAGVEMRNGERAVRDHGACRDLATALADAIDAHVRDLRRRLPSAGIIVEVDEPSLPSVLAGGISTASGIATYRAIDPQVAQGHLATVVAAAHRVEAATWCHCCAAGAPIEMIRRAGFDGVAIPLAGAAEEPLGQALDQGAMVALGVWDPRASTDARRASHRAAAGVLEQLGRWGFTPETVAQRVVLTPDCGLTGSGPHQARDAYRALREAGRLLRDDKHESA
jgi:methionine synthase II (cobalamin-independent)